MKSTTIRAAGALVVVGMAAACTQKGVTTGPAEPKRVERVSEGQAMGPFVQAGTRVRLTMMDAVSTESSTTGETFRATVSDDLASPGGVVVVPRGSIVRGHVARVRRGRTATLALGFDTVETQWGLAPLDAKLKQADAQKMKGLAAVYDPYLTSYDRFTYPNDVVVYPSGPEPPGNLAYPHYYVPTQEFRVAAGAAITIELTRAIVPRPTP